MAIILLVLLVLFLLFRRQSSKTAKEPEPRRSLPREAELPTKANVHESGGRNTGYELSAEEGEGEGEVETLTSDMPRRTELSTPANDLELSANPEPKD